MSQPVEEQVARRWPLVSAIVALVAVAALAGVIAYRQQDKPFGFELEWMGELVEHRVPFLVGVALVFNAVGGGIIAVLVIPIGTIVVLLVARRPWAALYFALASAVGAALVQLLKALIGRARPLDIIVTADPGSFPSGHSANAAILAVTLGILLARRWVWIVGLSYTLAMMLSRTYLGAHWISDTIGGALLGAAVAIALWAPFAAILLHERRRREARRSERASA